MEPELIEINLTGEGEFNISSDLKDEILSILEKSKCN